MKSVSPGRAVRARCRVLGRANSSAIGAPCVLASHPPIAPRSTSVILRRAPAFPPGALLRAAGDGELVLGVAKTLLDLPAVGSRLAAVDRLQFRLRRFELRA